MARTGTGGGGRAAGGWVPSPPDPRDRRAAAPVPAGGLPERVDLRGGLRGFGASRDQGRWNACFQVSLAHLLLYRSLRAGGRPARASARFLYWHARDVMGTLPKDSGTTPRDGLKALAARGWCDERLCRYLPNPLTRPSRAALAQAGQRPKLGYAAVPQELGAMRAVLAAGKPFLLCFWFTAGYWDVGPSGVVPTPLRGQPIVGGHCVLCVGHTPTRFICKDTRGESFGAGGDVTLANGHVTDPALAGDFWTLD